MNKLPEIPTSAALDRLVRSIVEHTHDQFGMAYFRVLVKHLSEAMQVSGAWVTEYFATEKRLKSLSFWFEDKYIEHYEYNLVNTPYKRVMEIQECLEARVVCKKNHV